MKKTLQPLRLVGYLTLAGMMAGCGNHKSNQEPRITSQYLERSLDNKEEANYFLDTNGNLRIVFLENTRIETNYCIYAGQEGFDYWEKRLVEVEKRAAAGDLTDKKTSIMVVRRKAQ